MSGARALHDAWTPGLVVSAALGGGERREGGCHQREVVLLGVKYQPGTVPVKRLEAASTVLRGLQVG